MCCVLGTSWLIWDYICISFYNPMLWNDNNEPCILEFDELKPASVFWTWISSVLSSNMSKNLTSHDHFIQSNKSIINTSFMISLNVHFKLSGLNICLTGMFTHMGWIVLKLRMECHFSPVLLLYDNMQTARGTTGMKTACRRANRIANIGASSFCYAHTQLSDRSVV